ncbi:MAG TPA: VCBS repeat-containing protein [Acidobacteriaceae bacterium]|nr:VCBS repeat-containing protein [Acidobacteriaceae bacterium]
MTHALKNRMLNFCLGTFPAGIVFSLLLLFPLAAFSQTPNFSAHSFTSAAGNIVELHGDLNNDGYEDLIIGTRVYLSKGNGSYGAPLTYTLPKGSTYYSALVGDFNGDGKLDLVVETNSGYGDFGVSTYLGNGDGTFRAPINSTVQYLYPAMAAADVNHDGKLDLLVITAHSAASLQVLFGNGDGSFTPGPIYGGDLMYEVDTILTGDFDGDGNVDAAVV